MALPCSRQVCLRPGAPGRGGGSLLLWPAHACVWVKGAIDPQQASYGSHLLYMYDMYMYHIGAVDSTRPGGPSIGKSTPTDLKVQPAVQQTEINSTK